MDDTLSSAIGSVMRARAAMCRYITGNDAGTTGSHQAGIYIPKQAAALLFDTPGEKGQNKERTVKIRWQDDFTTESRAKYYGQGTRDEYRVTRLGRHFPFLQDENVGDLLVVARLSDDDYAGYVLRTDEEIDGFLSFFNLAPGQTNRLIDTSRGPRAGDRTDFLLNRLAGHFGTFPGTGRMAEGARRCYNDAHAVDGRDFREKPDELLLGWLDAEYSLFRLIEEKAYGHVTEQPFRSISDFIKTANEVLNRRKARAGKSLEHHLADIFTHNGLLFEAQAATEGNKRPDFLFPGGAYYHDPHFPAGGLTVLGAKTTCKDRWRQVLPEADRVGRKYLFTLQQGISRNQLAEMGHARLTLVVPRRHIASFPKEYRGSIQDLRTFIQTVGEQQRQYLPPRGTAR